MGIFSRLFGRAGEKAFNVGEVMNEAFRLGESADNGDRQEAARLYSEVLQHAPTLGAAWFNLAVVQSRMGRWQEAARSFAQPQDDPDLRIAAAFGRLKLLIDNGQDLSDADFPPEFRGDHQGALGVQGPCYNAANELRNRGYACTLEARGESCSIHCHTPGGDYIIAVTDLFGALVKNVFRMEGDRQINLADAQPQSNTDREILALEVGRLSLSQAPVSRDPDAAFYRAAREFAQRSTGPRAWTRAGSTFEEVAVQNAADAKRSGINLVQVIGIEQIAKSNWVSGSFLACSLSGEPHAVAMLEDVPADCIRAIKAAVDGGSCVFRAQFFNEPEYPLVHVGLGLPARFMEGSKVGFIVVENVANFVDANFQAWVESVEAKKYTLVDVALPGGQIIASGRTRLGPGVIAELVECVDRANARLKAIPPGSQRYHTALDRFYKAYPEPFIGT